MNDLSCPPRAARRRQHVAAAYALGVARLHGYDQLVNQMELWESAYDGWCVVIYSNGTTWAIVRRWASGSGGWYWEVNPAGGHRLMAYAPKPTARSAIAEVLKRMRLL